MSLLRQLSQQAEMRARMRDEQRKIDVAGIEYEMQKAAAQRLRVVRTTQKNRAGFTQVITENLRFLLQRNYLTTSELAYLFALSVYVEMNSNAIVRPDASGKYMTLTDIAKEIGYSTRQVRTLTGKLIEKGVVYEFVDAQSLKKHGRVVEERPLYLNPEIIFCGDRNRINATLCRLVANADHIEKAKIPLPWKLWYERNAEYGRLYRRTTWLKKRKEAKG